MASYHNELFCAEFSQMYVAYLENLVMALKNKPKRDKKKKWAKKRRCVVM